MTEDRMGRAFDRGYDAYLAGCNLSDNPYKAGDLRRSWAFGMRRGLQDRLASWVHHEALLGGPSLAQDDR